MRQSLWLSGSILLISLATHSQMQAETPQYSKVLNRDYPDELLWGDTHLHTYLSNDANGMGNKSLTPDHAYRFAKGEPIRGYNGLAARLDRPLDFLVIADHAENMGVMAKLGQGNSYLESTEFGKTYSRRSRPLNLSERLASKSLEPYLELNRSIRDFDRDGFFFDLFAGRIVDDVYLQSVWHEVVDNAEEHNDPGVFTAFTGYEWTSRGRGKGYEGVRGNLHRVVIFKDGADKTKQTIPFSRHDSSAPEDLWSYLADYEKQTGGEVLAIPHNGNISVGEMFATTDYQGEPLSPFYAETRSRWEPLYEVTQIKGDGETHPLISTTDEFADYETWNSWDGNRSQNISPEEQTKRAEGAYARSALKRGLHYKATLGVNPFKFGMIGSTDAHTSMATADELNFWGKMSLSEPSPHRSICCESGPTEFLDNGNNFAASGYAAIWANENTRDAIFAAMKRRETYATTGPRMIVRFFGGWDFEQNDAYSPDFARVGYDKGVPMGSDLAHGPRGKAPSFLIRAVKDPKGANLDRVQVIKGWRAANGEIHEKLFNVALSDGRKDQGRSTKPVGNSVNLETASFLNSIGDPELVTVWSDPDFDPSQLAFYYVRVLEIPTPRWNSYDALFFDIRTHRELLKSQQERAYTSPIWYTPASIAKTTDN